MDPVGTEKASPNAFGSTPTVHALPPPLRSGKALRSWVTPETPSRRRTCSATSVENGWPTTLEMMNCEVSDLPMAASVLADAELPKIDIIDISASPNINALAVAPVRRGLRRAFWAASRPIVPNVRR